MSQANVYEQLMLQLINRERAIVGAQPLAFDENLNDAADNHNSWMLSSNIFSHTGINNTNPGDRMKLAGYQFSGSWSWGENIAWMSLRSPSGLVDEVNQLHINLMNSPGHRENILKPGFKEIGIGFTDGPFQGFQSALVTQDFAATQSNPFLLGVIFNDLDGDKFYDINEGIANATISIRNNSTGVVTTSHTTQSGGYQLELANGSYTVGYNDVTYQVTIASKNVQLDIISGAAQPNPTPTPEPTPTPTPPPTNTINGTSANDTLRGTTGDDIINGLGGRDQLIGGSGNDTIDGGSGNDVLYGNLGKDSLTGGTGRDIFAFNSRLDGNIDTITDFNPVDDFIYVENGIFTGLPFTGTLASGRFYIGKEAHDSTDRILYDQDTGILSYDVDGNGAASAQQFAQLVGAPVITNSDIVVY